MQLASSKTNIATLCTHWHFSHFFNTLKLYTCFYIIKINKCFVWVVHRTKEDNRTLIHIREEHIKRPSVHQLRFICREVSQRACRRHAALPLKRLFCSCWITCRQTNNRKRLNMHVPSLSLPLCRKLQRDQRFSLRLSHWRAPSFCPLAHPTHKHTPTHTQSTQHKHALKSTF